LSLLRGCVCMVMRASKRFWSVVAVNDLANVKSIAQKDRLVNMYYY